MKESKWMLFVFSFSLLYFLAYFDCGINIWDEGVPLSGALRMEKGERPLRDFVAYVPGPYILYNWALKISNGDIKGPRIAMSVLGAIIAVLVTLVTSRFSDSLWRFFPWIIYLLAPSPYYYRFLTFTLLLTTWILIRFIACETFRDALVDGLLGIVVIWFYDIVGIFVSIGIVVISVFYRDRAKLRLIVLFCIIIGWVCLVVYCGGLPGFGKAVRYFWETFSSVSNAMSLPWPPVWSVHYWIEQPLFSKFNGILMYSGGVVIFAGFISFLHVKSQNKPIYFVLVLMASIAYGLVLWRAGYGNFQRILPMICILYVSLVESRRNSGNRSGFALMVVSLLFLILLFVDSIIVNPSRYDSIGIKFKKNVVFQTQKGELQSDPETANFVVMVSDAINRVEKPGGTLACYPFHTLWNYLSGYLNTSYYEWLLPGMGPGDLEINILNDLISNDIDVFLINDEEFDGIKNRSFSHQYPRVMSWICRHYYRKYILDNIQIMKKLPERVVPLLDQSKVIIKSVEGTVWTDRIHALEGDTCRCLWMKPGSAIIFKTDSDGKYTVFKARVIIPDSFSEGWHLEINNNIKQELFKVFDSNQEYFRNNQFHYNGYIAEEIELDSGIIPWNVGGEIELTIKNASNAGDLHDTICVGLIEPIIFQEESRCSIDIISNDGYIQFPGGTENDERK